MLEIPALRGRTRHSRRRPPRLRLAARRDQLPLLAAGIRRRPDVLGRVISLEGHPFKIVGITPPGFTGIDVGRKFDVAVPLCSEAFMHESPLIDLRNGYWLAAVGRLKPGVTMSEPTRKWQRFRWESWKRLHPRDTMRGAKTLPAIQVRRISGSDGILDSAPELRDTSVDAARHRRHGLADRLRQYR